jgi:hypothetical protein
MSSFTELAKVGFNGQNGPAFLVRWRGQQQGPYTATVIEAKLASNQIGLLHEIYWNDQWITIRDFIGERQAALRSAQIVREAEERRDREEAERQAKNREEQRQADLLAEERRRNDLMEASLRQQRSQDVSPQTPQTWLKPHRGGLILTLGILGLFCFGIFGLFAWSMGSSDLQEMEAGRMDPSGRSSTASGRTIGAVATILWIFGVAFFFMSSH